MPKVAEVEKTDAQKLAMAQIEIAHLQKQLTDRDIQIDALQKKLGELEENLTKSQTELLTKFTDANIMRDHIERCHQGIHFTCIFIRNLALILRSVLRSALLSICFHSFRHFHPNSHSDIAVLKSNVTPVHLRTGKGQSHLTPQYRALVAELVKHGVSCGQIQPVVQACAKMFNVEIEGRSKYEKQRQKRNLKF